jgi:hypothetical protein
MAAEAASEHNSDCKNNGRSRQAVARFALAALPDRFIISTSTGKVV